MRAALIRGYTDEETERNSIVASIHSKGGMQIDQERIANYLATLV